MTEHVDWKKIHRHLNQFENSSKIFVGFLIIFPIGNISVRQYVGGDSWPAKSDRDSPFLLFFFDLWYEDAFATRNPEQTAQCQRLYCLPAHHPSLSVKIDRYRNHVAMGTRKTTCRFCCISMAYSRVLLWLLKKKSLGKNFSTLNNGIPQSVRSILSCPYQILDFPGMHPSNSFTG